MYREKKSWGFTGTRKQPTAEQEEELRWLFETTASGLLHLYDMRFDGMEPVLHHGDCVGADALAHDIADELGFYIVVHPPTDPKLRAFKVPTKGEVRDPEPYLDRNKNIIDETTDFLAVPQRELATDMKSWPMRGGTLSTIRYGIRRLHIGLIIQPSGKINDTWQLTGSGGF